jgi:hypothetical protein
MTNNKQQTAVDILCGKLAMKLGIPQAITFYIDHQEEIREAKEMEKEQSQAYAAFCVACDRKKLPLLEFEGWIKLEGGNK